MEQHQESDQPLPMTGSGINATRQAGSNGAVPTTERFPLLRHLSITSLAAMLITAAILVFLYRQDQFAEHENIAAQENEKTAIHLTHLLSGQIDTLISTAEGLDTQALRTNPNTDVFAAVLETVREHHIVKLKVFNLSGMTVFSSVKEEIGTASKHPNLLAKALKGETVHAMEFRETIFGASGELHDRYIANTYLPLAHAEKRIGAIEIYADATPIIERIFSKTITIAMIVLGAFAALYAALFFSVLRADRAVAKWQKTIADDAQKLAESEQKFHTLAEAMPQIVWITRSDGWTIYFNQQWVNYTGLTLEESYGHGWNTPFHPDDQQRAWDAWQHATQTDGVYALECRLRRADGAYRWWLIRGASLHDADGKVVNWFGTCTDIENIKQVELKDKALVRRNQVLMQGTSEGIHILDDEGNIIEANDAFCRHLGCTQAELLKLSVFDIEAKLTADELRVNIRKLLNDHAVFETVHRRKDGTLVDVEVSVSGVELEGQKCLFCLSRDITQRKQTNIALRESEERLRATIETSMDAVVQINAEGIITGWNSQTEEIFGWPRVEAIGRMIHETIIPPLHREAHLRGLKHFLLTGEGPALNTRIEIVGLHRDGHEFPIELTITPIKMAGKYEFSAFIRDITKKKESDELIWKQANFDVLTGLPNRHMFHDRMEQEIRKSNRNNIPIALMFIDLDRFKEINDTLGHDMGDLLLIETAQRLTDCVRATDIVARLGGDEFTVLLAEIDDVSSVERVALNILQKLAAAFHLKDEALHISASIGITLYPSDADDLEGMFKNADQAMYVAKEQGRNRHSYFTLALQETARAKLRLVNDLRGALAANQFIVYFQPIVELATGNIHKAEALIRWQHPENGMVSPAQFIPLAEETGLIFEIGDWVFHESMRWAKRWRALYNPTLQVSVNKSPVQFYKDGDDHTAWLSHLQELDLSGQCLAIEITEGLLLDSNASILGALLTLRDTGIQVSMDDFGTGYSSLSYLKKFDIDYLKIDQSFVCNMVSNYSDQALCEAIIVMAHKLGIKVIAEGVETEQQRDLLAAAGCDYAQGYLYSRPIPAEKFEELLKRAQ